MNDLFTTFWLPMVLEGKMKYEDLMTKLTEFNKDLAAFQAEQPPIQRTTPGIHNSSYANWPGLRKESIKLLKQHKFSIIQHPSGTNQDPKYVFYLRHDNGYVERYECLMVLPSQYIKPTDFGGLNTYMKRYTYTSILGITDPSEEDLDQQELAKEQNNNSDTTIELSNQDAPNCSVCGNKMKKRKRKKDGTLFWGCSGYPHCNHVQNL